MELGLGPLWLNKHQRENISCLRKTAVFHSPGPGWELVLQMCRWQGPGWEVRGAEGGRLWTLTVVSSGAGCDLTLG